MILKDRMETKRVGRHDEKMEGMGKSREKWDKMKEWKKERRERRKRRKRGGAGGRGRERIEKMMIKEVKLFLALGSWMSST